MEMDRRIEYTVTIEGEAQVADPYQAEAVRILTGQRALSPSAAQGLTMLGYDVVLISGSGRNEDHIANAVNEIKEG